MFAIIDIRKSALTFLAAAALSTLAGIASSVVAAPLAASAHLAAPAIAQPAEHGAHAEAGRSAHRLTRPANRFNGFVGSVGGQTGPTAVR